MQRVYCSEGCGKEFVLVRYTVSVDTDDIEWTGFHCPHCNHKYTAFYTNSGIRSLQELQRKLLVKTGKQTGKQLKITLRHISDLKNRIKVGMERLKQEASEQGWTK